MSHVDLSESVLLNSLNAVVLIANSSGEIIYANAAVKKIYHLEPEQILGSGWWTLTSTSEQEALKRQEIMIKIANQKIDAQPFNLLERPFKRDDGKIIWTQWTNSIISNNRVIGIAQDITEKKILEEQLKIKNNDNELLLQEIYHRVKNNLQIILSLLKFEFEDITDKQSINALNKTKARVHSMSLLHQQLCNLKVAEDFNLKKYIDSLLKEVFNLYGCEAEVVLTTTVLCKNISDKLIVNLGLLLVEIVSNALKHAFENKKLGTINVTINKETINGQKTIITVEDNGKGINKDVDFNNPTSLGFEILNSLTEQVDGQLKLKSDSNGTKVTMEF